MAGLQYHKKELKITQKRRILGTKINSVILVLALNLSKFIYSDRLQVSTTDLKERLKIDQKAKKSTASLLTERHTFSSHQLTLTVNLTKNQTQRDKDILLAYTLERRTFTPQIYLLKGDKVSIMIFDMVKYPTLTNNVRVKFDVRTIQPHRGYDLFFDSKAPNNSYFMIDSTKIGKSNRTTVQLNVLAYFSKGNQTVRKSVYLYSQVYVIDKYEASRFNFQGIQNGFSFVMRNRVDNLPIPLDGDHVFGNLLDVQLEQTAGSNSSIISEDRRILAKINPKVITQNLTYYENMKDIRISKVVSFTSNWYAMVVQRTDKPEKYQIRVYWFDFSGRIKRHFTAVVNNFEFVRSVKINPYFHIVVANYDQGSLQIFCKLKMENTTLTLSDVPHGVFYKESRFEVNKLWIKVSSFDLYWVNDEVCGFFYLQKPDLHKNKETGETQLWFPQRILLKVTYMNSKTPSTEAIASFFLTNITDKLNAKIENHKNFSHTICNKLRVVALEKLVLRCRLYNKSPEDNDSHLVYAIVNILSWGGAEKGKYSIDYIFSPPISQHSYLTSCFINLKQATVSPAVQKYIIQPFLVAFYEESKGLFMLSHSGEYIQLLDISEVGPGTKLRRSICNIESRTMSFIFTRNVAGDGKKGKNSGKNKVEETMWVFNMDSKTKANNRVLTKLKRVLPIEKDTNLHSSAMYSPNRQELVIGSTFYLGGFKVFFIRTTVDLGYPRISLSLNSSESFQTMFNVYTSKKQQKTGKSYFNFKVNITGRTKTKLSYSTPQKLRNGKYNFEDFLKVEGPLKSLQVVSTSTSPRIRITPRLNVVPFKQLPNEEYEHVFLERGEHFLGITKDTFVVYDFKYKTVSYRDYSMELKFLETACCSKNPTYYALFYEPSLLNSFRVEKLEVLYIKDEVAKTSTPYLFSRYVKPVDRKFIHGIDLRTSKQYLKSISDRINALIIYNADIIRVVIIEDGEATASEEVYDDTDNDKQVKMFLGKDISAIYLDSNERFTALDIVSLSHKAPQVRSMLLVIGTQTKVILRFLNFRSLTKTNTSVWSYNAPVTLPQPGVLNFIHCTVGEDTPSKSISQSFDIHSVCKLVVNSFIVKEVEVNTGYWNMTSNKSTHESISLNYPMTSLLSTYKLPRNSTVKSIIESEGYIGILAQNAVSYHKNLLIYKRGLPDVWSSIFIGYMSISTFEMTTLDSGITIVILKEGGTNLKVYQIGNMSLEVAEGYGKEGKFELFYSTFQDSRVVDSEEGVIEFAEFLKVDSNIFLFVYGSIGGFFGVIVLLWCCCCLWRCVYVCCIKRFIKRREKSLVPMLVKVRRKRSDF